MQSQNLKWVAGNACQCPRDRWGKIPSQGTSAGLTLVWLYVDTLISHSNNKLESMKSKVSLELSRYLPTCAIR